MLTKDPKMKKVAFIFILVSLSLFARSQNYSPLPDSGGTWINHFASYYLNEWNYPVYDYHSYVSFCTDGEDTLINATTYYQVDTCDGGYKGAMREDNGVVYYVPGEDSIEYLLYDFTADSGDTIYDVYFEDAWGYANINDLKVHNTDAVQLDNGEYRKRLYMEQSFWIEGIGNSQGLFWEPFGNVSMYFVDLQCFLENDSIRFKSNVPDSHCNWQTVSSNSAKQVSFSVYPNPAQSQLKILFQESLIADLSIKNIQGKLIKQYPVNSAEIVLDISDLEKGTYFIQLNTDHGYTMKRFIKL